MFWAQAYRVGGAPNAIRPMHRKGNGSFFEPFLFLHMNPRREHWNLNPYASSTEFICGCAKCPWMAVLG